MMGGAGGPAPAPGPEEEVQEEDLSWLEEFFNNLFGGGDQEVPEGGLYDPWGDFVYSDGAGGYTDAYGNYPAAYPDFLGLEGYGQEMLGYAEEVPVVGGLAHEIRRRGLAVPVIVGGVLVTVIFLRSKRGKKMIAGAKKKVSGAKKK
jgi:hypothetical protein